MQEEVEEYPVVKKDSLGRVVIQKNSSTNLIYREYYGHTMNPKLVYRKFNEDVIIDGFDLNSNHVIEFSDGRLNLYFGDDFIINNGMINFSVENKLILEWERKLK